MLIRLVCCIIGRNNDLAEMNDLEGSAVLQTERLVIKPYSDEDQAGMTLLLTDERIKETFMIPDFSTAWEAALMFEKLKRFSYSEEHYEKGIYINGGLIGFVNDVVIEGDAIEIGYVIHPDHQKKGYATEALSAVIDDLFSKGYREVRAAAFADNAASLRVMEKCGMRRTEETSSIFYHGSERRCVHCSIQKSTR